MDTLYINNENLGPESYVGTRDQFKKEMSEIPFKEWYSEYVNDCMINEIEPISFEEWADATLDEGLNAATDEEIDQFPHLSVAVSMFKHNLSQANCRL